MISSTAKENIEKLIPALSIKEKQDILGYFAVYDKYADAFSEKATEDLKDHPVFGKLIREIPKEISDARNKLSKDLQKDAIINNNWFPYIEYQIEQGITYAKMGLDFKSWYEVIAIVRTYFSPWLLQEYGNGPEFLSALNGMNCFMDIAMGIIGEAYMQEKKEIIKMLNKELEQKVIERTAQLESVNKELEAFTYSVSHDLRAPLRAVNGYAQMLYEDYGKELDEEAKRIIEALSNNAIKMGTLIDELLEFSRLGRKELQKKEINFEELTKTVLMELNDSINPSIKINIGKLHNAKGDYSLIKQVMLNLISNAIKFSSKKEKPVIEIFSEKKNNQIIYSIKDNGAGFNMKYYDKLFQVFQRLHKQSEFDGVGVGLAIVQRIVSKHAGEVWAEGKENEGAQFNFSITII